VVIQPCPILFKFNIERIMKKYFRKAISPDHDYNKMSSEENKLFAKVVWEIPFGVNIDEIHFDDDSMTVVTPKKIHTFAINNLTEVKDKSC
jgi:hypothetical protein